MNIAVRIAYTDTSYHIQIEIRVCNTGPTCLAALSTEVDSSYEISEAL